MALGVVPDEGQHKGHSRFLCCLTMKRRCRWRSERELPAGRPIAPVWGWFGTLLPSLALLTPNGSQLQPVVKLDDAPLPELVIGAFEPTIERPTVKFLSYEEPLLHARLQTVVFETPFAASRRPTRTQETAST